MAKLFAKLAQKVASNPKLASFGSKMVSGMVPGMSAATAAPTYAAAAPVYDPSISTGAAQAFAANGTPVVLQCSLSWMTYMVFGTIVFFLIGVILLVASQQKCKEQPNSTTCSSHKNGGITLVVLTPILIVIFIILKLRG